MSMTRLALALSVLCALASHAAAQVPDVVPVPPQPFAPSVIVVPFQAPVPPRFDPGLLAPFPAAPQRAVPVVPAVPAAPVPPKGPLSVAIGPRPGSDETALYEQARSLIDQNRYDMAVGRLDRIIQLRGNLADAAMYWKAYSLSKLARQADALGTIAEIQKSFASSRWLKDARALEVEIRQQSGQQVNAGQQDDEELKLLALRGLMQHNPELALPAIEGILSGTSSVRVKDRALFVVTQSGSPRARDLVTGVAKGGGNPELQMRAIRYLGMMGGNESRQALDEVYRSSSDVQVRREILRGFMMAGARERLLALAKSERMPELRGEAAQQLGMMGAAAELDELYRSESSPDVKQRIMMGLFMSGAVDRLSALAKAETDPELRRTAIRHLGFNDNPAARDALATLYQSDSSPETRRAVIDALFRQGSARTLVSLARAEKNAGMKKEIVELLSRMDDKEATEYLLELLK
jgi:HEAT repeat protein